MQKCKEQASLFLTFLWWVEYIVQPLHFGQGCISWRHLFPRVKPWVIIELNPSIRQGFKI